jgi:hypothetical protein
MSLGISQLLERCARANEGVQRGRPNILGDKGGLGQGTRLRFGLAERTQDKKTRLAHGRVRFRGAQVNLGTSHAANITSWRHNQGNFHSHSDTSRCFI